MLLGSAILDPMKRKRGESRREETIHINTPLTRTCCLTSLIDFLSNACWPQKSPQWTGCGIVCSVMKCCSNFSDYFEEYKTVNLLSVYGVNHSTDLYILLLIRFVYISNIAFCKHLHSYSKHKGANTHIVSGISALS